MTFQVPVHILEDTALSDSVHIKDAQICIADQPDSVSDKERSVSKSDIRIMVQKVAQILAAQGVPCCECPKTQYKLYPLSDWEERKYRYSLHICCPERDVSYHFELTCAPIESKSSITANKHQERK